MRTLITLFAMLTCTASPSFGGHKADLGEFTMFLGSPKINGDMRSLLNGSFAHTSLPTRPGLLFEDSDVFQPSVSIPDDFRLPKDTTPAVPDPKRFDIGANIQSPAVPGPATLIVIGVAGVMRFKQRRPVGSNQSE